MLSLVAIVFLAAVSSSHNLRPLVSVAAPVLEKSESMRTMREEKISLPVSSGNSVEIAIERLGLDAISQIPSETKALMGKTYGVWVNSGVFVSPKDTIYFAVSDSYLCGAQNCLWVLFRYDELRDELRHIPGEIFGTNITFSPSPQRDLVILESQSAAGACRGSFSLFVLDTNDDTLGEIPLESGFDLSYTESVQWIDNDTVEIVAGLKNCSKERGSSFVQRRYQHHIPR